MHYENAVDDHDANYDQRQQQAGRSVPRHCALHQKHQLVGETRHGGQQQHVKGRVWRSSCGAHMQFFSTWLLLTILTMWLFGWVLSFFFSHEGSFFFISFFLSSQARTKLTGDLGFPLGFPQNLYGLRHYVFAPFLL
jgi:hypothetical protein